MSKLPLGLILLVMLWGCCTKKDCGDPFGNSFQGQPLLSVRVKINPKPNTYARIQVYKTLKGQPANLLDSMQLSANGDQDSVVKLESKYGSERTLNFFQPGFDYLIVHKQYGISDTLTEYQYQSRKEEKGCNDRFILVIPLRIGYCDYYNIHHIENVSFRYNGRLVQGGVIPDTLILK